MTLIRHSSPLAEIATLRNAMDRLFDERFFRPIASAVGPVEPALDLYTTADAVVAKTALPGVKPEDVEVTIADDLVTIRGSYAEDEKTEEAGYVRRELSRGEFERQFVLPAAIKRDAATAVFKDGLLTLTLPKAEAVRPQRIEIKAG